MTLPYAGHRPSEKQIIWDEVWPLWTSQIISQILAPQMGHNQIISELNWPSYSNPYSLSVTGRKWSPRVLFHIWASSNGHLKAVVIEASFSFTSNAELTAPIYGGLDARLHLRFVSTLPSDSVGPLKAMCLSIIWGPVLRVITHCLEDLKVNICWNVRKI